MYRCSECSKVLSTPQGLAGHTQFKHRSSPMGGTPYQGYSPPSMPQNYPTIAWAPYPMPYPYMPAPPANPYVFHCEECRFPIDYSQAFGSIIECPSCSETRYLTPLGPNNPQTITRVLNCAGCGKQMIWGRYKLSSMPEDEWYCKECHEHNVRLLIERLENEKRTDAAAEGPYMDTAFGT